MSSVTQVTEVTFKQEVLESELPVLVDFWAPWCGPCRIVAPRVDEVAAQYAGQVKVVKLDTDQNPSVASQYGIRSIPPLKTLCNDRRGSVNGGLPMQSFGFSN